jgi:HlyD family secretion protein
MASMLQSASEASPIHPAGQPVTNPVSTPAPAVVSAPPALALERELAQSVGGRARLRRFAIWTTLTLVIAAGVTWRIRTRPPPQPRYILAPVTLGDVVETVQSTGTVQPLTQVQVGAQISGRITKVMVDFNSIVKKDEVLAEIDPTLLDATVEQHRAQLKAAEALRTRANAALKASQAALDRSEKLHAENLASQADVDQAHGLRDVAFADLGSAEAQIVQLRAQLEYSTANVTYARILAPIDGLVVSRNVDPGQTVASSLQAPTLFVIAQDLRKMRVLAEIDEADVGKLKEGMVAETSVDAFAGEVFEGIVSQVRYNPNSVQGVVTYLAVVDVENPDMKLRPGMTATVTVKTREAKRVLRLPNAALRFKPSKEAKDGSEPKPEERLEPVPHGKGRIYLGIAAAPGKEMAEAKVVDIGISDGINTELKTNELSAGTKVVTDESDQDDKKRGPRLF